MTGVAILRQRLAAAVTRIVAVRAMPAFERGQTLVEYALILAFVVLAAVVAVSTLGGKTPGLYHNVSNGFLR